jgi:homoserine/homoserine lactone efflux protein
MSFEIWLAYFAACWLIAVSPGAGAVLSMSHGLAYGVRQASVTIMGLQLGLLLLLAVAGAGVGALLLASATAFTMVKVVGAAYLIYLGISQWRAPVQVAKGEASVPAMRARRRFWLGFFTNATNPKGIVFMAAVLPQFMDPARPVLPQLFIMGATMCAVDVVVMHGYAGLASAMQRFSKSERALRTQNRVFGGLLMAAGAALLAFKRGGQAA